jgi:4-hydroxy-tetrahydrodipicolinate reductase
VKLAFLGDGRMGSVVLARAREAGHEIGVVLNINDAGLGLDKLVAALRGHNAAIDFSAPDAVLEHVAACARAGVPLVEGTTGWQAQESEARRLMDGAGGAMVFGANFSIGVHVFYRLVDRAGELFRGLAAYDAFIEEAHHANKRDAPSGTALYLRALLARRLGGGGGGGREVPIASTRAGHIPGVHRVGFDSAADEVTLIHTARSRDGFAAGALAAARWITGKRGVYAFADVLDEILEAERKAEA